LICAYHFRDNARNAARLRITQRRLCIHAALASAFFALDQAPLENHAAESFGKAIARIVSVQNASRRRSSQTAHRSESFNAGAQRQGVVMLLSGGACRARIVFHRALRAPNADRMNGILE
jgi:hypothetical protein